MQTLYFIMTYALATYCVLAYVLSLWVLALTIKDNGGIGVEDLADIDFWFILLITALAPLSAPISLYFSHQEGKRDE